MSSLWKSSIYSVVLVVALSIGLLSGVELQKQKFEHMKNDSCLFEFCTKPTSGQMELCNVIPVDPMACVGLEYNCHQEASDKYLTWEDEFGANCEYVNGSDGQVCRCVRV